jgi:hypothetical protein
MFQFKEFLATFLTFLALATLIVWLSVNPPAIEQFASLSVIGPTGNAGSYFTSNDSRIVGINQTVSWNIQVYNHMGSSQLFLVYVFLENRTISGPDASTNTSTDRTLTPLPLVQEYHAVSNDETWNFQFQWALTNKTSSPSSVTIHTMNVNGRQVQNLDVSGSTVNPTANNFRLVIELWSYNIPTHGFLFSYVNGKSLNSVFNQIWFTVRP